MGVAEKTITLGTQQQQQQQPQCDLKEAARRMISCLDACGRLMVIHSTLSRQSEAAVSLIPSNNKR